MNIQVSFYTRENCKLCDEAKADLEALQKDFPHELIEIDIDEDPDLVEVYGNRIPVIKVGPFTLDAPFDKQKLKMTLGAAQDAQAQRIEFEGDAYKRKVKRKNKLESVDRISYIISKHYLAFLNVFLALYVGMSFVAPVLMNAGYPQLAKPIYSFYGVVCHKLAFRSWFLFGEQPVYPREAANVEGYATYGEATRLSEENLFEARGFNGNEAMGYKVAFCQRDVAIWGMMFVFGLLYAVTRRKIPALPWYLWILIGIAPIGLDGFSQLFSQMNLFSLPYRESTPILRTLTGSLFGFTTAWFGFPILEETFEDTRKMLAAKRARIMKAKEKSTE
jgi:uncharacterized membrane protein